LSSEAIQREYLELEGNLEKLNQQALRVQVENEAKQERLELLKSELEEAGINLDDLDGEKSRLEAEMQGILDEGMKKVKDFSEALQGENTEETEPLQQESENIQSGDMDGLDLD